MDIENLFKNINLNFKIVDEYDNVKIIKIIDKANICYLQQSNNQFVVDRDTFEYLDANNLPYYFLLEDCVAKKYYYLPLRKEVNWVKSCFESCTKDELYLGKQVLNSEIKFEDLKSQLAKCK